MRLQLLLEQRLQQLPPPCLATWPACLTTLQLQLI